jgi:DNA-binding winged helix-turn-helix (wHTH) protein/tetratricopeptide (TPR) repeat protein
MYEFPPFRLDTENQCLLHREPSGKEVRMHLAPKAFSILQHFVANAERLVTHDELMDKLWPETFVQQEVLASHVRDIRAALGDNARKPQFIETVARRGYRFIAKMTDHDVAAVQPAISIAPGRLVGRETSFSRLQQCYRLAAAGQRQLIFITGEPGIGKTALCLEFLRRVRNIDEPPFAAWGQCIEGYGIQEPYSPMLKAIGELCKNGGEPVTRVFKAKAPTCIVQFADLISPEQRAAFELDVRGATSGRMLREVLDALEALADSRPLIIVLDDLQWVDRATVDLISDFARRQQPARILLIGGFRPLEAFLNENPIKALKDELLAHRLCSEITLAGLTESDIAQYLDEMPAGKDLRDGLANLLYRRSEGNPLFMVAALEHSFEQGLISKESGHLSLSTPLDQLDLDIPQSLWAMIEAQINHLSTEEYRVLEAASVAGAVFSPTVIAEAAGHTREEAEDICHHLARASQIVRTAGVQRFGSGATLPLYEFVHVLYREVLYEHQPSGRRAARHQLIGNQLESLYQGRLEEVAAELAVHFEHASDWNRAVAYLRIAAETSERRYAHREAIALLSRALELASRIPADQRRDSELQTLERLATIYVASFDSHCVEAYERLAETASDFGLAEVSAQALLNLATCISWDNAERCVQVAQRASGIIATLPDPLTRSRMQMSCDFWRVWAGGWNPDKADQVRQAFRSIRHRCSQTVLAPQLIEYGMIQWAASEYRESYECISEGLGALSEALREQNPYLSIAYQKAQFYLPRALLFSGEWGRALQALEGSIALADKNGDSFPAQMLRLSRAWIHFHAMDFRGVLEMSEPIEDSADRFGGSYLLRLSRLLCGSADVALENYDRAFDRLMAAQEEMNSHAIVLDWCFRLPLHAALSEFWLRTGTLTKSREEASHYRELAQSTDDYTYRALASELSARVSLAEKDLIAADHFVSEAVRAIEEREVPLAAWRVHATAAQLYENIGKSALARSHREAARAAILSLTDSLGANDRLRATFLSAPVISAVLEEFSLPPTTPAPSGNGAGR